MTKAEKNLTPKAEIIENIETENKSGVKKVFVTEVDEFVELPNDNEDIDIAFLEVSDTIIGTYEGVKNLGDYPVHKFRLDSGELKGLFSNYQLEYRLTTDLINKKMKIEYLGKVDIANGKSVHDYRFYVKKS